MALPHASPLDVVSVRPLGTALSGTPSSSLVKTDRIQLLHMVLRAHQDVPEHHVDDECVIQCIEGRVAVAMPGGTRHLDAGDLVVLPAAQRYALSARSDCALLVTLLLRDGDASDGPQRLA
jgi:quercetin dioxygenase-like cupin family protein